MTGLGVRRGMSAARRMRQLTVYARKGNKPMAQQIGDNVKAALEAAARAKEKVTAAREESARQEAEKKATKGKGADGEKKRAPNSKEALGIPTEHSVCWVPFAMPPGADFGGSEFFSRVAQVRDTNVKFMLANVIKNALANPEVRSQLEADAAKYVPSKRGGKKIEDMDVDELAKEVERMEAEQRKIEALLAARRGQNTTGGK